MNGLLQAMIRYFEGWLAVDGAGSEDLRPFFTHLQTLHDEQPVSPRTQPAVEQWLEPSLQQLTAPHCTPLVAALRAASSKLHWAALPDEYVGAAFARNFAFTQVIGSSVDVAKTAVSYASTTIAAGFSLQAPHQFYPPHQHKAIEFYGVLAGTARWQLGHTPPQAQPPGRYIFHDSNLPHAMQTNDEPLLCIWGWIGDLNAPIEVPSLDWL